jgi:hypothetical protein
MFEHRVGVDGVSLTSTNLAIISPICAMVACIIIICAIISCCPGWKNAGLKPGCIIPSRKPCWNPEQHISQCTFHFAISEPSRI